jgi:transcriptional regulator of heat shock response
VHGTLGVIGPTRMDYSKLISLVGYTAKAVSEHLTD